MVVHLEKCEDVILAEFLNPSSNDAYLAWTAAHWTDGYVINTQRSLNPSNARLHLASCPRINGVPPRGNGFVGPFIKICAESLPDLIQWARTHVRAVIQPCSTCHPLRGQRAVCSYVRNGGSADGIVVPPKTPYAAAVSPAELDRLVDACRGLRLSTYRYEQHDYMTNVLLTVLDLQTQQDR